MGRRLLVAFIALAAAVGLGGCGSSSSDTGLSTGWSVNGGDPVSVVEGYFAAWEGDTPDLRADLVDTTLVELSDEPPTSIERLDVFMTQGDAHQATCEATFDLAQVISSSESSDTIVERSKHTWVFELMYYEDCGSYIITGIERD